MICSRWMKRWKHSPKWTAQKPSWSSFSVGYAEMQRIIREEEPPKPSTRLSTLGGRLTVVARDRSTDPKKLGQLMRGELDWIV